MRMSLPSLLNPQTPKLLPPLKLSSIRTVKLPTKYYSLSPSLQSSFPVQNHNDADGEEDDHVIGDCLVFEEGVFEDPYLQQQQQQQKRSFNGGLRYSKPKRKNPKKEVVAESQIENLVPEQWREVQAEINITKKERRKIAQELEFNSRVERKKKGLPPIRSVNLEEYKAFKEAKLAQLKPLVLGNPSSFPEKDEEEYEEEKAEMNNERVAPKNPKWAVYGRNFDDVSEFFNSPNYVPGQINSEGKQKLFTKEEKILLNRRIPDIIAATSIKWLPLHTLAASGEFYLLDALLKHNVDINAVDVDGLTALHRAIICKKQAITSYLLRESANPFAVDGEGATLMHYAVHTAFIPAIKLLILYNVNINIQDNDGWTPLHVAVQARRIDIVKLLLIKGADKTLKTQDGLTPLDLCLYSGRDVRSYELIKLLKSFPKTSSALIKREKTS